MAQNINRVLVTGNLTADPELKSLPSGTSVCRLRIAVNGRIKDGGEWRDKANFFDVTVWGTHGENCARYLARGRPVAIDGRLDWREWEAQDGSKRQAVQIIADTVQFLSDGKTHSGGGQGAGEPESGWNANGTQQDDYARPMAAAPAARVTPDDDIPF